MAKRERFIAGKLSKEAEEIVVPSSMEPFHTYHLWPEDFYGGNIRFDPFNGSRPVTLEELPETPKEWN